MWPVEMSMLVDVGSSLLQELIIVWKYKNLIRLRYRFFWMEEWNKQIKYHEEVEDRLDSLESWPCSFLIVALVGWFVDVLLELESSDAFEFASGWTELVVFFFDQSRQSCYKINT